MQKPDAIQFPELKANGRVFVIKLGYTAMCQLGRWGRNIATASMIELAAAMACETQADRSLRNCGFERSTDFTDALGDDFADEAALIAGVTEAIKNRYPELAVSTAPGTIQSETSSEPGPSPSPETVSV